MSKKISHLIIEATLLGITFVTFLWAGTKISFAQTNTSDFAKISNGKKLRASYDLSQFKDAQPSEINTLKIAVIDREFAPNANSSEHGKFQEGQLPDSVVFKNFDVSNSVNNGNHGTVMAQIVWEMFSKNPYGPKLYLLKTSSHYRSLDAAVDYAIKNKVQIILHSHNHLFGSNFNGVGVYDTILKKAYNAGIIWVNSVGNEQKTVFSQPVLVNSSNENLFVNLPDSGQSLKFRVLPLKDKNQKNPVRVVLSWNDFPTDPADSASTDLDLRIYNLNTLEYLPVANRAQVEGTKDIETNEALRPSSLAKEEFSAELEPGDYSISVLNRSKNFNTDSLLQIVVSSPFKGTTYLIQPLFTDRVLYPADSKEVIAVGDKNTSFGVTTDERKKPDLLVPYSIVELSENGKEESGITEGSSNSAAIFAGVLGRLILEKPDLSFEQIKEYLEQLTKTDAKKDLVPAGIPIWTTPTVKDLNSLLRK